MKKEGIMEPGSNVGVVVGQEEEYHTSEDRRSPPRSQNHPPSILGITLSDNTRQLPLHPCSNNVVPRCGYATSGDGNAHFLQDRPASRYDYHVCPVDTKVRGQVKGVDDGQGWCL
jgi:hypothetical protein